jgi:hypothetical protein
VVIDAKSTVKSDLSYGYTKTTQNGNSFETEVYLEPGGRFCRFQLVNEQGLCSNKLSGDAAEFCYESVFLCEDPFICGAVNLVTSLFCFTYLISFV